jgi:predicted nucleotidyltransferase
VQHVLERLVRHGLVSRVETGRTYFYRFNRQHLLAPVVEKMVEARVELVRRLRASIAEWGLQPVHASLFGSAARGDGDENSDIDLLVVRPADADPDNPAWRESVDGLAESVLDWTGNYASIVDVSEDELTRMRRDRPPVVEELEKDAVDLAGQTSKALLRGR